MTAVRTFLLGLSMCLAATLASAHPAPFSYIDITVNADRLSGTVVLHAIDVATTLGMSDPPSWPAG